jgi:hypothetical protein
MDEVAAEVAVGAKPADVVAVHPPDTIRNGSLVERRE